VDERTEYEGLLYRAVSVGHGAAEEQERGKVARAKTLFDIAGDMALDASHELKKLAGEIK